MIGVEVLDDPGADPALVAAELRDLRRINTLFGGTRAVVQALLPLFRASPGARWTLLDVGTGSGDIPLALRRVAAAHGVTLSLVGLERIPAAAGAARAAGLAAVLGDGGALPFPARSVDIVIASQVLHHFPPDIAAQWIAGFDRVARRAVVVADLRRSPAAMAGLWLAAHALRLHPATRHDGVLSLRRGYSVREFAALFRRGGVRAAVRRSPIARLVASWTPAP
ncbi:MAG TPA: methyltransferase domain-containing protein [Gemmatimonadales bacterium]